MKPITQFCFLAALAAVGLAASVPTSAESSDDPTPEASDLGSGITLYLYTQATGSRPDILKPGVLTSAPSFNASNPTRIVTHGFAGTHITVEGVAIAYLSTGRDYNVILVDWPAISLFAVKNSKKAAQYLATVVQDLVDNRGLKLADLHLIGHSLGGQLVGVTGNLLNGKVAQIVGLDAAGSSFEDEALENRLDPTDAVLVQGIHTNGGGSGFLEPLGDIDFFPNGGSSQAGCILDVTGICSHFRAIDYFIESIKNGVFSGVLCDSYDSFTQGKCKGNVQNVMGENASGSVSGTFYLKTNRNSPYAQGLVAE